MTEKKLQSMPYAQAKVIIDGNNVYLKSYSTIVCGIRNGIAFCNGLYSRTTIRHISVFAREYSNLTYYDFKAMYRGNYEMDIASGQKFDVRG